MLEQHRVTFQDASYFVMVLLSFRLETQSLLNQFFKSYLFTVWACHALTPDRLYRMLNLVKRSRFQNRLYILVLLQRWSLVRSSPKKLVLVFINRSNLLLQLFNSIDQRFLDLSHYFFLSIDPYFILLKLLLLTLDYEVLFTLQSQFVSFFFYRIKVFRKLLFYNLNLRSLPHNCVFLLQKIMSFLF